MKISKTILVVMAFSFSFPSVLFSSQKTSGTQEKVIWQVCFAGETDKNVWIDLKAHKEENSKPAKGLFHLWRDDKTKGLYLELAYLLVDDNYAWFASRCIKDKDDGKLVGRWLFIAVHDGGAPGRLVDHLWCEWLPAAKDAEQIAKRKVKNLEKPKTNRPIGDGNIVVNSYDQIKDVQRL